MQETVNNPLIHPVMQDTKGKCNRSIFNDIVETKNDLYTK